MHHRAQHCVQRLGLRNPHRATLCATSDATCHANLHSRVFAFFSFATKTSMVSVATKQKAAAIIVLLLLDEKN